MRLADSLTIDTVSGSNRLSHINIDGSGVEIK